MKNNLQNYKKIFFSQWGEDGILEEIFRRIGTDNKFCVEFGAGNGFELSNVWHLIKNCGWQGLLMEARDIHFVRWTELMKTTENLEVLNVMVDVEGENSLDVILKKNDAPKNLDLLSIDIDSNDYLILKNLKDFEPRVLIIEHNPTIPPEIEVFQEKDENVDFGASALAIVNLARSKGYKLAAATHTNCIFVHGKEFLKLGIEEPKIDEIFDRSGLTYVMSALNGTVYLENSGKGRLPSFTWLYPGYDVKFGKKGNRAFSFGLSLHGSYSKTLSSKFKPVKIFLSKDCNSGGIFNVIIKVIKDIVNYKRGGQYQ